MYTPGVVGKRCRAKESEGEDESGDDIADKKLLTGYIIGDVQIGGSEIDLFRGQKLVGIIGSSYRNGDST